MLVVSVRKDSFEDEMLQLQNGIEKRNDINFMLDDEVVLDKSNYTKKHTGNFNAEPDIPINFSKMQKASDLGVSFKEDDSASVEDLHSFALSVNMPKIKFLKERTEEHSDKESSSDSEGNENSKLEISGHYIFFDFLPSPVEATIYELAISTNTIILFNSHPTFLSELL